MNTKFTQFLIAGLTTLSIICQPNRMQAQDCCQPEGTLPACDCSIPIATQDCCATDNPASDEHWEWQRKMLLVAVPVAAGAVAIALASSSHNISYYTGSPYGTFVSDYYSHEYDKYHHRHHHSGSGSHWYDHSGKYDYDHSSHGSHYSSDGSYYSGSIYYSSGHSGSHLLGGANQTVTAYNVMNTSNFQPLGAFQAAYQSSASDFKEADLTSSHSSSQYSYSQYSDYSSQGDVIINPVVTLEKIDGPVTFTASLFGPEGDFIESTSLTADKPGLLRFDPIAADAEGLYHVELSFDAGIDIPVEGVLVTSVSSEGSMKTHSSPFKTHPNQSSGILVEDVVLRL